MAKKTKRGHGEGSIYQRSDGRWVGQVSVGYDPANSRNRRLTFYGKTKKEVQEKMREAQYQHQNGTLVEPSKLALGQWLDDWLNVYVKNSVKLSTWENYKIMVETHLKPSLGHFMLKDLRPEHVQVIINQKLESGRKDGKGGLSSRHVNYMITILNMALKQALKSQLIVRNVLDAVQRPKRVKHEFKTLNVDELNILLKTAKDHRFYPLLLLESRTGIRRSELVALMWDDLDLEKSTLTIRHAVVRTKNGLVISEPKTRKTIRTIELPKMVIAGLKAWRVKQNQEKLRLGPDYQDNNLIFCSALGTITDPRDLNRLLDTLLKKANLPKIRFHDLRHSVATILLKEKIHPKIVQELLGHDEISTTLDIYSHIVPGMIEQATQLLDSVLGEDQLPGKKRKPSEKEG
ncbi:MAG: site-specific integrase [Bacillota bacterium]